MTFVLNVVSNVVANLVFWLGLGVAAWAVTAVARRRFLRFFGLDGSQSVTVYLSNLWSPQASGRPIGYTISMHEFRAAQSVGRLFGNAPLRLPEMVRGLVDGLWLRRVVEPDVKVSPLETGHVAVCTNSIIVGAASRNAVRAAFVDSGLPYLSLRFEHSDTSSYDGHRVAEDHVMICRGTRKGEVVSADLNIAVLEKLHDVDRDVTLFFCAGVRGDSSWATVEYLVRNWSRLRREFGDRSFALCLGFPAGDSYLEHYVEPRRLVSIPG